MRSTSNSWLLLLALAGCPSATNGYPGECMVDRQCDSDQVCARDESCASPSGLHELYVKWTIDGAAPTDTTCQRFGGDFSLTFVNNNVGQDIGFEPVPCNLGQFHIDKMPPSYIGAYIGNGRTYAFDGSGMVTIPL